MFENAYIIDIEANAINATKIHCLCYQKLGSDEVVALTDYEEIKKFILQPNLVIIGHNFSRYDRVQLARVLNIKTNYTIVDTLGLSWILKPEIKKHGLEEYGESFGIPKVKIADDEWVGPNEDSEEYPAFIELMKKRCSQDVRINYKVWEDQYTYLNEIYDGNLRMIKNFIKYIEFKLDCVAEQEEIGVRVDLQQATEMLEKLQIEKQKKVEELENAMPKVRIKATKTIPDKIYKKDGSVSEAGKKWFDFLTAHDLPLDHTEPVEYIKGYKSPNANSHTQVKDWLYSLGWVPQNIKFDKNKVTGEVKQIPQISHKDKDRQGEVCDSIKELFVNTPTLEILEGLTILSHRISIFKGFIRDSIDGRLYPTMAGLTNTMRLKHSVVVNLPKVEKLYGEAVRGCFIADEGKILCGSDLTNIESQTRNHYIFPYDPQYVADMTAKGFDSHFDIAILAGFVTKEEEEFFKYIKSYDEKKNIYKYKLREDLDFTTKGKLGYSLEDLLKDVEEVQHSIYKKIGEQRSKGKTVNFAAIYGVSALTLSRNSGLSVELCKELLIVYWKRNWSVRKLAEDFYVKEVRGQKWLYNPISKFYYSLRYEKDRFSTGNQSSAVFVFDLYVLFVRKFGIKIALQMHDEILFNLDTNKIEETKVLLKKAMDKVNEVLKLNVTVGSSADFALKYSDCH